MVATMRDPSIAIAATATVLARSFVDLCESDAGQLVILERKCE